MEIKITNEEQLADYKRELERMEFQYSGAQEQIKDLREAIAAYERNREDARVAEIAAGLSDKAKERLEWVKRRNDERVRYAVKELESKGLENTEGFQLTPLGLKVLAELQKPAPLPERWGVFGNDSHMLYCECCNEADAKLIAAALFRYGLFTHVLKL